MRFLKLRIGLSQRGSWFAQAEAELTEHTLALTYPDGDADFCSIQVLSVFPSQMFPLRPASLGGRRKIRSTASRCFSPRRRGRPGRSPSSNPARPSLSKRPTQYSTDRGASPSRRATSGQVMPCATKSNP